MIIRHRLVIAAVVVMLTGLLDIGRAAAADKTDAKQQGGTRLVSIVFLLKEGRTIDVNELRKQVAKTFGKPFGGLKSDANFVLKFREDMYPIRVDGVQLGLISVAQPYVADREAAAKTMPETRLRDAVRTHKAWMSIDAFGEVKEADREATYRLIAKLMVALAGDDVLAVYAPETGRMVWYEPRVIEKLKGDHPLEAFKWEDPLIGVAPDDPDMKAAVQKARDTFPEFAKAFGQPKPGQHFAAKGYFGTQGRGEFMWVTVTAIKGDVIQGTLDNRPGNVKELSVGDPVEIKVPEVNDWLIIEADRKTRTGGYTIEVVAKRMNEASPKQ
jgi:uncharacterized protein YegJ (DUF2314 family)